MSGIFVPKIIKIYIGFQVTVKNVGNDFFETQCSFVVRDALFTMLQCWRCYNLPMTPSTRCLRRPTWHLIDFNLRSGTNYSDKTAVAQVYTGLINLFVFFVCKLTYFKFLARSYFSLISV